MNQLCKVCGEPAAGFHFGAFTCEGCKSFFGRTYNNLSSISECKNNGECVINKKNRTACKACRLRKCLLVGMSKSGSRYGRRSNWFKIHCLLQEQQQAGATFAAAAGLLRPQPYLPLFRTPPPASTTRDTRSSSSDSGASSADPEDDSRSLPYKPPHSPASLPEFYPSSRALATDSTECARRQLAALARRMPSVSPAPQPKWLPPPLGVADPSAWRDLWLAGAAPLPVPEPDQDQPIDLSVKPGADAVKPGLETTGRNAVKPDVEGEIGGQRGVCVGLEVEEGVKTVPLDLTLDRQSACSKTNACSN